MRATKSAVEQRRVEIGRQLTRLRAQLARKSRKDFTTDFRHESWLEGTDALINELFEELSALDCPGEYDELPAAVVADELGLTYEQVRNLIRLGEIAVTGRAAHERISRVELERITAAGAPALLRLGEEASAEIFERAAPQLQNGDLEAAQTAYRRLDARQSWRGPHAPAFLVGLELATGDLDGALSTVKLIYECEDPRWKVVVMTYLGRLLRGMALEDVGARELRAQFIVLAEGVAAGRERSERHRPKPAKRGRMDELQQQAIYLTTAVVNELRKCQTGDRYSMSEVSSQALEQDADRIIRDALYTALYAEVFYEKSSRGRMYVDMTRSTIPKSYQPASLLASFSEKAGRGGGR